MEQISKATEKTNHPAKVTTPIDISVPMVGIMDHGLTLVHDMTGAPRNYLHEVSFADGDHRDTVRYLQGAGYSYRCGWIAGSAPSSTIFRSVRKSPGEDGRQMWTYTKAFPLTVAAWDRPESYLCEGSEHVEVFSRDGGSK